MISQLNKGLNMKKIIFFTLLILVSSTTYAENFLSNIFSANEHNYTPIDSAVKATDNVMKNARIDKYFISNNTEKKYRTFFSTVNSYNYNTFNEERILTFHTSRNKQVRVVFISRNNKWIPSSLSVNNKKITKSETLNQLRGGLARTEESNRFPTFQKIWNKNNRGNHIKNIRNLEAKIYDLQVVKQNNRHVLNYNFIYSPNGKKSGWLISGFNSKAGINKRQGSTTLSQSKSYDLSNYVDGNSQYTSPVAHYSNSVNGLISSNNNSTPKIIRVICDQKHRQRSIRLTFLLSGQESVDRHIDGYDISNQLMNLRLDGRKTEVSRGNCKNLAILFDNKGLITTVNLSGFGVSIKGSKNGYGRVAGRSFIDFKY